MLHDLRSLGSRLSKFHQQNLFRPQQFTFGERSETVLSEGGHPFWRRRQVER